MVEDTPNYNVAQLWLTGCHQVRLGHKMAKPSERVANQEGVVTVVTAARLQPTIESDSQ